MYPLNIYQMKKILRFHGCAAALVLCVSQIMAQDAHTGLQMYRFAWQWRGLKLGSLFVPGNTATGTQALNSCTSCFQNVADGYQALYACTSCSANVGVGYQVIEQCTTCNGNVGIGESTLADVTTALYNTGVGFDAMSANSTSANNTAVGAFALGGATGANNTAVGYQTLLFPNSETNSTAVGMQALSDSHSSGYNTAVGAYALLGDQLHGGGSGNGGAYNTVVGANALYNDSSGYGNAVVGYDALYNNTAGSYNSVNGYMAMYDNSSGYYNVADGIEALLYNTTGTGNTGVGTIAMYSNITGSYNTGLGYAAYTGSSTLSNATALGADALVNASNAVVVGSSSVTSIGGYAGWTNFSDGRYKKNIQQNVPGLAFINKLNPVTYTLDVAGIETKLHQNDRSLTDKSGSEHGNYQSDPIIKQAIQEKSTVTYTGFVAQDVEKAADSVGYAFSGIDKPKDINQSFYGLRYGDFVPSLVKAVQELSASSNTKDSLINSLIGEVDSLDNKYNVLQAQLNELRALLTAKKSSASLDQNVPNPFTGSTVIGYNLPEGVSSAQMQITDLTGKVLAAFPLSGSGKNALTANVAGYAAGTYCYSLIVNGQLVATKQMISVR